MATTLAPRLSDDPFDLDTFEQGSSAPEASPPQAYLDGLNPPQYEAVTTTEGPLLVLSGAGTGKTKVLTTRIGHIISTGRAAPWNILAVTFTNKAAKEMKDRVAKVVGRPLEGCWIGTFHAICVRILRRHAELCGLKKGFTILDSDDQTRLLKQIIVEANLDEKRWPARTLAKLIDRWKNLAMLPGDVPEEQSYMFADGRGAQLYALYQKRLQEMNTCDFGDLLLHCVTMFNRYPGVLKEYHRLFKYILVDEYQDTNIVQYKWLHQLSKASHNICCVGDDDQSIYRFRCAEVGNILNFTRDFPGAHVVKLEQNYRSTGHILAAASSLIATNTKRLSKTLWTADGMGEKIDICHVWDGKEEARSICEKVGIQVQDGEPLNEIAILVRTGFQMREIEERLIKLNIPYRVVGGPRFYERAEIRDAMAYLRTVHQSSDDLAFERILNVPKRGLGESSLKELSQTARIEGCSLHDAAEIEVEKGNLRPQAKRALRGFLDDLARWRSLNGKHNQQQLTEIILEEAGYFEMWKNDKSPEAPGRIENVYEMMGAMGEFENLDQFLEHIALVTDRENEDEVDCVTLMTLHAAKGLEFETVYLPGWEEGLFPNKRAIEEEGQDGLEEERRLGYVGITRAKKKAYIYHAKSRMLFGQWQHGFLSRFIEEIPLEHLNVEDIEDDEDE